MYRAAASNIKNAANPTILRIFVFIGTSCPGLRQERTRVVPLAGSATLSAHVVDHAGDSVFQVRSHGFVGWFVVRARVTIDGRGVFGVDRLTERDPYLGRPDPHRSAAPYLVE